MSRTEFLMGLNLVWLAALAASGQEANKLERIGFTFGPSRPQVHVVEGTNAWAYRMVDGRVNDIHRATNWFRVGGTVKAVMGPDLVVQGFWGDGKDSAGETFVLRNFSNEVARAQGLRALERLPGMFMAKWVGETNVTSAVVGARTYKVFDYGRPVPRPTIAVRP